MPFSNVWHADRTANGRGGARCRGIEPDMCRNCCLPAGDGRQMGNDKIWWDEEARIEGREETTRVAVVAERQRINDKLDWHKIILVNRQSSAVMPSSSSRANCVIIIQLVPDVPSSAIVPCRYSTVVPSLHPQSCHHPTRSEPFFAFPLCIYIRLDSE